LSTDNTEPSYFPTTSPTDYDNYNNSNYLAPIISSAVIIVAVIGFYYHAHYTQEMTSGNIVFIAD
jgi:hypothetical protein